MRILVLYRKVLENYRYFYDHLQLVSKFKNNYWDISNLRAENTFTVIIKLL